MMIGVPSMNAMVIAVSMLILQANGATLSQHHEHDSLAAEGARSALMRRDVQSGPEKDDVSSKVHVSPHGEMAVKMQEKLKHGHEDKKASKVKHQVNRSHTMLFRLRDRFEELSRLGHKVKNLANSKSIDLCNDAYMQGPADGNDCAESWQSQIDSYTVCETAAQLDCPDPTGGDNYPCIGTPFTVEYNYQQAHPAGCTKVYDEDKKQYFWFFNPTGMVPASPKGIPVCVEFEFQNGTQGSMDTCPEGYSVIMDEYTCRTAAQCQDFCAQEQFRVMNEELENAAPKGCHIAADGCLMFNNKSGDPTCDGNCNGAPMCNATIPAATTTAAPADAGL
mmetsp:Transcript_117925/g.204860  ORF Transcript_117925/g.204860 Transcript_117925/m.204860 type:complete len:335 (+) Transcript_117925:78-1082(+)